MKNNSSEYWRKRFLQIEEASNSYGQETAQQIISAFEEAEREIQAEIEKWYGRYAKNNNVSLQEAKKRLTARELKELQWDVKEYIEKGRQNAADQSWLKELENASARAHISRLEALKLRTQQAAEKAFGNELDQIDGMARTLLEEDYYRSIFEIQKGFGVGWNVGQIDQRKLDKLIVKPWAADGKNFSERIWSQRASLVNELHQQLTRTCIMGKAPDGASKAIAKKFNTTRNQAGRLVMTEQAYFHSVAQKEAFKELDVEKFEIVATLDSHTSEICQEMDGQRFQMSEYEPGVTAPPFHVWCRSVTVPYFEDNYTGERAARGEDGKTYFVPDSMTYEEWKKAMVDGDIRTLSRIANRSSNITTEDTLQNVSKSSIINMKSVDEIIKHFNDAHGVTLEGFGDKDLLDVKILMAAFDDALNQFPDAKKLLNKIFFDKKLKDYGRISTNGLCAIGPAGLGSYGTGIHETLHALDFVRSVLGTNSFSEGILKRARKSLGLRKNAKKYTQMVYYLTNSFEDAGVDYEVFAYAIETELGKGKSNELSQAIYDILMEVL